LVGDIGIEMANYDRIDLMNFVRYGNDIDEQWDEIRSFIKSNASAQRELEEIRKTVPQSSQASRRKMENFEPPSYPSKQSTHTPSNPSSNSTASTPGKNQSWWQKIMGDD
jgi:FtsZ-interacting cell division protein ZipA